MVYKIKKIVYRIVHPFFWAKGIIIGVIVTQISLVLITILWIINITKIPEKPYIKKSLNARRALIKNLKLANIENYVWRPVLNCESILSDEHYKSHLSNKSEKKNCITMSMRFSKVTNGTLSASRKPDSENKYVKNELQNVITYNERVEKPCLICHKNKSKSLVKWVYHVSPQTSRHLSGKNPDKIIKKSIFVAIGLILIFWLIYSIIRLIMHTLGKLNVIALVFLNRSGKFTKETLPKINLKKSNFLYAELGEHFLRGYMAKSKFLKWLELLAKNKVANKFGHSLFQQIQGSVMQTNDHNNFEGIRISQMIAKKAELGRIIFEQSILPDPNFKALNNGSGRKIVWQLRRSNYIEPEKYQFVDLGFESITDLVEIKSLTRKGGKNE